MARKISHMDTENGCNYGSRIFNHYGLYKAWDQSGHHTSTIFLTFSLIFFILLDFLLLSHIILLNLIQFSHSLTYFSLLSNPFSYSYSLSLSYPFFTSSHSFILPITLILSILTLLSFHFSLTLHSLSPNPFHLPNRTAQPIQTRRRPIEYNNYLDIQK